MTPSGIEPAPFWFVAQCLNQLRHRGPNMLGCKMLKTWLPDRKTINMVVNKQLLCMQ
jgi:hypothetical protein